MLVLKRGHFERCWVVTLEVHVDDAQVKTVIPLRTMTSLLTWSPRCLSTILELEFSPVMP